MKRWLPLLFATLLVGCEDDKQADSNSKAPPPPEQGGVLGHAVFKYKCTAAADAQCDFDEQLGTGTGGSSTQLPPVALGAKFGLDFTLNTTAPAGAPPDVAAFHADYATSDATGITTVKVGNTTVGLRRGPDVVDMLDVKIVEAKNLKVFSADPTGEFKDVSVSGGRVTVKQTFTFRFRVAPADGETLLAGTLPCNWTTSDANIAKITSAPDDNIVTIITGAGSGTATVHVDLGTLKTDIPITVGGN